VIGRAAILAAVILLAGHASAGEFWTGTWVGGYENGGAGVQLIMVGDEAVGLSWRDDYVAGLASTVSPDEQTLKLAWTGGDAVVTPGKEDGTAAMVIHEPGKPDVRIALDRETE